MRDLVTREKDLMRDDYQYWQEAGVLAGFEAYARQQYAEPTRDNETRMAWVRDLIKEERAKEKGAKEAKSTTAATSPAAAHSCHELLKMIPLSFRGEAAKDLHAVYQFEISGAESFTAHLQIKDNQCLFHEGPADKPDVIIKSPADVWMAVSEGKIDGQTAFMSGKYRVEGDLTLLIKMKDLFQRESP